MAIIRTAIQAKIYNQIIEPRNRKKLEEFIKAGENLIDLAEVAALNGAAEIVTAACIAGADINEDITDGKTILVEYLESEKVIPNRKDVLNALLDAGANANIFDENGATILMFAACYCEMETVKALITHGAFITNKDRLERTVLDYPVSNKIKNMINKELTDERKVSEYILLNPNEEFCNYEEIKIEKIMTLTPYYILSDTETNIPIGTFVPNKGIDGLRIYDECKTLKEAIDNVRNPIDTEEVDNII